MHRYLMSATGSQKVDHKDPWSTLDNRRNNLRIVTNAENSWNSRPHPGPKTSKYKGVWLTNSGRWAASLMRHGRKIRLGVFSDQETAAKAYNEAAKEAFGEFARVNHIDG